MMCAKPGRLQREWLKLGTGVLELRACRSRTRRGTVLLLSGPLERMYVRFLRVFSKTLRTATQRVQEPCAQRLEQARASCRRCFRIRCSVQWHARARAPAGPGCRVRRSCRTSVPMAPSTTGESRAPLASRVALLPYRWRDGNLFSRTGLRSVRENSFHR